MTFAVQGASLFFFIPAARCEAAEEIIEPVAGAVVQYSFQGSFPESCGRIGGCLRWAIFILWEEGCHPVIGVEESHEATVATCGQEGDQLRGGEDVLFFYFQGFLVYEVIHAIPVLVAADKAPFLIQMHQGTRDP